MKALPTDTELVERGYEDCGDFFLYHLRGRPEEKKEWCEANARRWEDPMNQPIERAVHHLLNLLVRTVKLVTAGRCSKASKHREQVSKEEVELFRAEGGLRRFVGPAKRR